MKRPQELGQPQNTGLGLGAHKEFSAIPRGQDR
jgi:hypothetical protein